MLAAVEPTEKKSREDRGLFEQIKSAINGNIRVVTPKINDVWVDSSAKHYTFIVE